MEDLTDEQINAVINWMDSWEQLKDTAIPLRFKHDFSKSIKPQIGIVPRWLHDQLRQQELMSAIIRYIDAGKTVPVEWVEEFNELNELSKVIP